MANFYKTSYDNLNPSEGIERTLDAVRAYNDAIWWSRDQYQKNLSSDIEFRNRVTKARDDMVDEMNRIAAAMKGQDLAEILIQLGVQINN